VAVATHHDQVSPLVGCVPTDQKADIFIVRLTYGKACLNAMRGKNVYYSSGWKSRFIPIPPSFVDPTLLDLQHFNSGRAHKERQCLEHRARRFPTLVPGDNDRLRRRRAGPIVGHNDDRTAAAKNNFVRAVQKR
jgi:hypothetical protein